MSETEPQSEDCDSKAALQANRLRNNMKAESAGVAEEAGRNMTCFLHCQNYNDVK